MIGGAEIFGARDGSAEPRLSHRSSHSPEGDTYMPSLDKSQWRETGRECARGRRGQARLQLRDARAQGRFLALSASEVERVELWDAARESARCVTLAARVAFRGCGRERGLA